jgi:hypothetical protein
MTKIRSFINNQQTNDPINLLGLTVNLEWNNGTVRESVSINNIEYGINDKRNSNDAYQLIKQYINSNVGVIEGLPFKIDLDNEKGTIYTILNGYLDVWGMEQQRNENGDVILVDAIEQGKLDWFNDVADSVSFEYLYSIGKITQSDFVKVPYCINKKNNTFEIVLAIFSFFVLYDKLKDEITKISEMASSAVNPFEATVIARAVFRILYITTLLLAFVKVIIDLYNYLIQPVKYHTCMSVLKMFEIGCNHFGLNFKSSIFQQEPYNKLYWLPEKFALNERNSIKGVLGFTDTNFSNTGYYQGTFGDFVRMWQVHFNAKMKIIDNDLYFEKYDFNPSSTLLELPNLMDSSFNFKFNKDDFYSNILISYATDLNDKNTIQNYKGTSVQVIQNAITVNNAKMNLAKNLLEVRNPFARGDRKTELNFLENLFDSFFKVVGGVLDTLISVLNALIKLLNQAIKLINKLIKSLKTLGIDLNIVIPKIPAIPKTNLANLIENRIGMLQMETDYVNTPKAFILDVASNPRNTKVNVNNYNYLNAKYIWDNYYYFISFVPKGAFIGNQYKIRELQECSFTFSDYEKIRLNNKVTYNGVNCEVLSLNYNPFEETATGVFREPFTYLTNIQETIIEPNGN